MNETKRLHRRLYGTVTLAWQIAALSVLAAACGGDGSDVDPVLIGSWEIAVPSGRWVLTIDASGRYAFVNESGGAAASHSGEFLADSGRWSLRSTTSALQDEGTYQLGADGALQLAGNLGTLRWGRSVAGPAPTGSLPAIEAPQPAALAPTAGVPPQVPVSTAPTAAVAPAAPARATPAAPAPESPALAQSAATLPAIIDPCLLVTGDEATEVLGVTVTAERRAPQAEQQNDCLYRASGRTLSVRSYNGRGMDPAGYLARRRDEGGQPLTGIGDGATIAYRDATGITSVDFVIGHANFNILISGIPRERAEPAIRTLATQAVTRLKTSDAFQVPGTERFVGTWIVSTRTDTGRELPRSIWWIENDGALRMQTTGSVSGTLLLTGSSWRIEGRWDQEPLAGEYRLRGDDLTFQGAQLQAQLTRVACGAAPKTVKPPYDLTRDLAGFLDGSGLARLQVDAGAADPFNVDLAGLWEGEGSIRGQLTQALVSIDDRGRSVFGLFPFAVGRIDARDGNYRMFIEGHGESTGTYRMQGGISDGSIEIKEESDTMIWTPYDTTRRRPYETPIVGHCRQ
jgi:hypothetical protein